MSVKIMAEVWDHADVSGGELVFLLALADRAADDHRCAWPGVRVLMFKSRASRATIYRYTETLEDQRIIERCPDEEIPGQYGKHPGRETVVWRFLPVAEWLSRAETVPEGKEGSQIETGLTGETPGVSNCDEIQVNKRQTTKRKKTSSPSSARTRSARSSHDDGPDKSTLADINDELRPGTRPLANTRRVSTDTRKPRKSPAEHIHAPRRRNAGGLACYWGEALEKVGSLEKSEEAIVGKFFKEWLGRGADLDMLRAMIDVFFADPELSGSSHRWKRFVSNAETIHTRVMRNFSVTVPGVDEETEFGFDVPDADAWLEELGASA